MLDDAPGALIDRFETLLLGMQYADPKVRPLLDLEGLKTWSKGRTTGYASLDEAIRRFGTIDEFVEEVAARFAK